MTRFQLLDHNQVILTLPCALNVLGELIDLAELNIPFTKYPNGYHQVDILWQSFEKKFFS